MMTTQKPFLHEVLQNNGYHFSSQTEYQLLAFLDLLQKWNRVTNLTAVRDPKGMIFLHILDSLSISHYLHGHHILDVGTGAGLPGIPLALTNPDKHFVLLDSNSKKTRFLTQAIHELNIKNAEVVNQRSEDFHPVKCFDSIVTRAFAAIPVMLNATQHLICEQGRFLAMKGIYPEKEIQAIPDHFKLLDVHALKIKGLNADRHLVCVEKNF